MERNKNAKMIERMQCIKDTLDFKEPKKVPVKIQYTNWPYFYAGVTLKEVMHDPELNAKSYMKILDDIEFDLSLFGVNVIPVGVFQELKSNKYALANDDTAVTHSQGIEEFLGPEFYPDIIKDPFLVQTETLLKTQIPIFRRPKEEAMKCLKASINPFLNNMIMQQIVMNRMDELGIVRLVDKNTFSAEAPFYFGPLSSIMDYFRGMQGALTDLRRRPKEVKAACDAIMRQSAEMGHFLTDVPKIKASFGDTLVPFGLNIINAECFLSPNNFKEYYLDYFKEYIGPYLEAGAKYYILGEGKLLPVLDQFKELPRGSVFIQIDEDDPFEAYKKIKGHQTICAGISLSLLKYGTKQECIDYAKKCFDTFAPGGGFIFMHNKTLVSSKDINNENLLAVYEFANEYGKK
ncbi:uroporphyrinogen decarboxylase/cobalamine-independent methonine synthase family protein [Alkalibacter mobilis]|uniref:hypothetical protein n=1 Tax=Alkalibacter mobilis TaxID=2787712 RepID=UPI00189F3D49|nr:hypothetical protein [Alkalibacter mobilis]MBF7097669.1 hypothetical protein [Alkalibacter mobilis]